MEKLTLADKLAQELTPIAILIVVISLVVWRLPKVDVGHSREFRRRRLLNWLPLGLTYAFLYMGRYNLIELMNSGKITNADFGDVDAVGSMVYGIAFLLNGPLADRWGGRITILIAAAGAAVCNGIIGIMIAVDGVPSVTTLTLLFGLNMYFQSFGAVSIVKVNASWFHLRERGTFGGIFGILISLGFYFALDWAPNIARWTSLEWLFLSPAVILVLFWVLSFLFVRDTPAEAGLVDFDVADASSGDDGPPDRAIVVIKRLLSNRVILVIAFISLCAGFLRQGILKWYRSFGGGVGLKGTFVFDHWGMVSCIAGISGGMFAGIMSDHLFHSRRPPVAALLFAIMLVGSIAMLPFLSATGVVSWLIAFMAMAIIGVNGMLSGVASQDFGGRRNAGTATGLIDGFVYFGTALQGVIYGHFLPEKMIVVDKVSVPNPAVKVVANWTPWPMAMIPAAAVGLALSLYIYKAVVKPNKPKMTPPEGAAGEGGVRQ